MKRALLVSVLLAACSNAPTSTSTQNPTPETETAPQEEAPEVFGDALVGLPEVSLMDLVAKPLDHKNAKVRISGTVRTACQQRGCWMEVRPTDSRDAAGLTVRFEGYSFFMPKNSRSATVTVEGVVQVVSMTPEQVKHHEDEGGEVASKNPDGSATTLLLMAYGVEMRGRAK